MKKLLCLLMAFVISLSCTAVSFAEDAETATVVVLEDLLARGGGSASTSYGGADQFWVTGTDLSYLKFDVSELRTAIGGTDAKYTLTLTSNQTAAGDVNVYGISGANRTAWNESFTYNDTHALGMNADVSNLLGTITVTARYTKFSIDVTEYINTVPEDGIATLKLQNTALAATVSFYAKHANVDPANYATLTATRTYREGSEEVFDGIEIPEIVDGNITLPTTGDIYGSTISWESSNPEIITADGVVTKGESPATATLTATYVGYDIKKSFEVTVLEDGAVFSETINILEDVLVRDGNTDNWGSVDQFWVRGNDASYLKFNVSSLRTAMNNKDAKYTLSVTSRGGSATGVVNVYGISGENRTAWSEAELIYNDTVANGMAADESCFLGSIDVTTAGLVYSIDVTRYINTVPEDGIATIKFHNTAATAEIRFLSREKLASASTLTAERTCREGSEEIFEIIDLPGVTTENITLPTAGDKLVWSSSHPEIITTEGVVTRGEKTVKVALTATYEAFGDLQRTFYVIVPKAGEAMTASDYPAEDTYTREGGKYSGYIMGGMLASGASGLYKSYIKFDVSKIREDLSYRDAKYTLQLKSRADNQGGLIYVYGINGTNRYDWSEDAGNTNPLTFNLSAEKGMHNDVTNKIGEINVGAGEGIYTIDVTDYINSVIELDNIGTIKLQNPECTNTVVFYESEDATEANRPVLIAERTYKEVDYDILDGIEVPKAATENLRLPTLSLTDEEISWSSSNPEIIAIDGTVTRQAEEAVVTLTVSGAGKTKSFDVIVPKAGEAGTLTAAVLEDVLVRTNNTDNWGGVDQFWAKGDDASYLKFNVKDLRTAMNGKDAKYTLSVTSRNDAATGVVNVYGISGENRTAWSEKELTYNDTITNGMSEDVSCLLGSIDVTVPGYVYTVDVTDYIMSVPEDGIATIKFKNTEAAAEIRFWSREKKPAATTLTATRTYEDDYSNGLNPVVYVNGKASEALSAGVATARVAFVNNGVTAEDKATLVFALYNGNELENVKTTALDFVDTYVNDMSISLDVPEGEGYSVKAFLVSGADSISPLTQCVEIK